MYKPIWVGVVATGLLAVALQAQAGITFQVAVSTHYQPGPGSQNLPPDDTVTSQVLLDARSISVTTPGRTAVFDFASRRRYDVDLKAGTYVDYSLFDTVGFRVMEVQSRANLRKMLAAAKIDAPAFDPVFDEQSLSISSQAGRALTEAFDGADTVFSVDGKALLRFGAGGAPVGADYAAAFTRYLRYQFGGHPLVLAKLASLGRVPDKFVMYYREVGGSQTRTFTISGLKPWSAPVYDLVRYKERIGGADEIDQLLDRARATRAPTDADRIKFEAQQDAAFADKRGLDAMLGAVEWSLMTGAQMKPFSPDRQALLQSDPAVRTVSGAMQPRDKAGLSAAAQVMKTMQAQTMSKRHVLQLFDANDRIQLGERAAALPLYASVLRANPALAGAYKDMGDALIVGFDMPRGWRSWDQGRRIAPQLNLFEAVNEFEQKLAREHPEYF